ncbi:hypothetical protein EDB19DRAFT_1827127 [Suillus lakei]|nr:hypothetical protein EDB19DRAFT_1827127 [Suillus lakei]
MSHLLLDGTFKPASTIIPNLSCMQYCMHAVGVIDGYNCVANGTSDGLLEQMVSLHNAEGGDAPGLPCLLWNMEHTVLQVDGSPLIISAIRDMVNSLIHRANTLITLLCEGVDMANFGQCLKTHLDPKEPLKWPKDPLHNNTPGYSFIQDPDNPFKAFQDHLLQSFYDKPQIFNKYHVHQPTRMVFKQGGPARGTELETYHLTNTHEGPHTLDLGPQDNAISKTFGHSTNTGRPHYGLTWINLPSLHQDMLSELFQVLQHFWTWLDNSKGTACEPQISYTDLHEMALATLGKLQVAAAEQTVIIQEMASNNKLILDMLQSTHEKIDCTYQAIIQAQAGSGHASQSPVHNIGPMDIAFIQTQGLHAYLTNSSANFKTIQQALAVEVISQGSPHVFIVMPTGAGKSPIYGSLSYVENAGFHLIIVPY